MVEEYGGVPVPITVVHLAYLPQDIVVPLPHEVYSMFEEREVGIPKLTEVMKKALKEKYNC